MYRVGFQILPRIRAVRLIAVARHYGTEWQRTEPGPSSHLLIHDGCESLQNPGCLKGKWLGGKEQFSEERIADTLPQQEIRELNKFAACFSLPRWIG